MGHSAKISRRDVLAGGAALISATGQVGISQAATAMTRHAPAGKLHLAVADEVIRLLAGKSAELRLLMPEGCGANVQPVAEQFTQATGVPVILSEVGVDAINTRLTIDTLSNQGDYDIALPATFGLPDLASFDVIQPLTEYAQKYEPAGFRSQTLFRLGDTFDEEIYGFQTDGDVYVMFYNAMMMDDPRHRDAYADRYGHSLELPKTWAELDRQMAFFHRPTQDMFGGALFRSPNYLAWEWWLRFHAKGVWPLSPDLTPQIASAEGVAALEEMIAASASLYSEAPSAGLFRNWEHFAEGQTFCNIGWGGTQKYLNGPTSQIRGKMHHASPPGIDGKGACEHMSYFNWGWNYVVTSVSTQPELAYLFCLFASSSVMSTDAVSKSEGFFDPFRPEHYANDTVRDIYSSAFLKTHQKAMTIAIPDLYLINQTDYFVELNAALDTAINGNETPVRALERAATQWDLITRRSDRQRQQARWNRLRAKYPPAAQLHLRDL